jgi:hypothetical protein
MNRVLKSTSADGVVVAVAVVLLLIVSLWGAVPMFVGSVIALVACCLVFNKELRERGWLATTVLISLSAMVAAAIAMALSKG